MYTVVKKTTVKIENDKAPIKLYFLSTIIIIIKQLHSKTFAQLLLPAKLLN